MCRTPHFILIICSVVLSTHALAFDSNYTYRRLEDLEPSSEVSFTMLGKGLVNEQTGDVISIACSHLDQIDATKLPSGCNSFRFLYFKKIEGKTFQITPKLIPLVEYYDGERIRIGIPYSANQDAVKEKEMQVFVSNNLEQMTNGQFGFLKKELKKSWKHASFDQRGWNWVNNPVKVSSEDFAQLYERLRFYFPIELPYSGTANGNDYLAPPQKQKKN